MDFRRYNFIINDNTAFLGYILPWGQMSLWGAQYYKFSIKIPIAGEQ